MKKKLYLISYDIADPKRLGRVAMCLCRCACRVQNSLFAAHLNQSGLSDIFSELEAIINPREDDIRAYPLSAVGDVTLLGTQFFATNALLVQNGHSRLELLQDPADND